MLLMTLLMLLTLLTLLTLPTLGVGCELSTLMQINNVHNPTFLTVLSLHIY
jgi:hypothetical protein